MSELTELTVTQALSGLAKGSFSSHELTEAHIAVMEAHRGLNAYVTETPE